MKSIFFLLLLVSTQAGAQTGKPVVVMDFVRVKDAHFSEAIFFYENNWKLYRDTALQKRYISGYRLLQTRADSIANFHLVLITEYADSLQYSSSEKNFEGIIKGLRPNGPLLINDLKPAAFRENLYYKAGTEVFAPLPNKMAQK